MDTPTLDQLAWKHGNDKSTRIHGFTRAYEPHLQHLRQQPIKHQLTDELNMYGRCGYGMPENDPDYTKLTYESPLCRDVEFIAFYKSIALVHKKVSK